MSARVVCAFLKDLAQLFAYFFGLAAVIEGKAESFW